MFNYVSVAAVLHELFTLLLNYVPFGHKQRSLRTVLHWWLGVYNIMKHPEHYAQSNWSMYDGSVEAARIRMRDLWLLMNFKLGFIFKTDVFWHNNAEIWWLSIKQQKWYSSLKSLDIAKLSSKQFLLPLSAIFHLCHFWQFRVYLLRAECELESTFRAS